MERPLAENRKHKGRNTFLRHSDEFSARRHEASMRHLSDDTSGALGRKSATPRRWQGCVEVYRGHVHSEKTMQAGLEEEGVKNDRGAEMWPENLGESQNTESCGQERASSLRHMGWLRRAQKQIKKSSPEM